MAKPDSDAMLLADRFLRERNSWFDLATGEAVMVAVHDAGPLRAQIDWAERCAMLAALRHAALNPLIDFGVADRGSFFEAYARSTPLPASPATASRLIAHASRFLAAHGISMTARTADLMVRRIDYLPHAPRARPIGYVLQPRRAHEAFKELLAAPLHQGATMVRIVGPPGSGLRTFATTAAHLARVEGYVPVSPRTLVRWPALAEVLAGRHLCLIGGAGSDASEQAATVALLARVAGRSARPHIYLALDRTPQRDAGHIELDALGMTCMTTMTYIDPDLGPSPAELFDAARKAEGLPGRFVSALAGRAFARNGPAHSTVHEAPAAYRGDPSDCAPTPASRSRIGSVLWRAGSRASSLARRGRHAHASRLLSRAARVLEGRGDGGQAARCWLQLGWLARARGDTAGALESAARSQGADATPEAQLAAGCLFAVCLTDESKLPEAEASLRSLIVGAAELDSHAIRHRAILALGRVLLWQGRPADTLALLMPVQSAADRNPLDRDLECEARLLAARAHAALGDLPAALRLARDASSRAAVLDDSRLRVASHLAIAESLGRAGDVDGVRREVAAGLSVAGVAHLPLKAVRLRGVLLRALREGDGFELEAARLRAGIERTLKRPLPALLARWLTSACAPRGDGPGRAGGDQSTAAAEVELFLEIAQRSTDDLGAVRDVASAVLDRLTAVSVVIISALDGRPLIVLGKPWRERTSVTAQALASGRSVPVDSAQQPPETGEPIRCGGELIGAIGCRWVAGAMLVPDAVARTLRAGAMALATHLRSVLDRKVDEPAPSAWCDLLGDSAGAGELREAIQRASRAPFPVLIEGESGSGKELVARAIHKLSARHARRFCAINCAALSDELVEAELFGHTRGAFTGATTERAGLFEEADGGTLFLDEIGELSARAQAKLLRVVQEGEVRRVGENQPRRVDVRIVAATNRRLEHEAAQGRFRSDLRFRLDVLRIVVPPLRERLGDIPVLAQHFWQQACARVGSSASLGPDALAALARYDWPGNVRELQNAVAWISVHAPRRGRVSASMLPRQLAASPLATGSFEAAREEFERRFVRAALAQAGGQRQAAAKALGMSRQGLAKMLRRLGIEPDGIT